MPVTFRHSTSGCCARSSSGIFFAASPMISRLRTKARFKVQGLAEALKSRPWVGIACSQSHQACAGCTHAAIWTRSTLRIWGPWRGSGSGVTNSTRRPKDLQEERSMKQSKCVYQAQTQQYVYVAGRGMLPVRETNSQVLTPKDACSLAPSRSITSFALDRIVHNVNTLLHECASCNSILPRLILILCANGGAEARGRTSLHCWCAPSMGAL